jgi:hypothetical protein
LANSSHDVAHGIVSSGLALWLATVDDTSEQTATVNERTYKRLMFVPPQSDTQ